MSNVWRPLVAGAGVLTFVGGGMHPDAPPDLSFRENLAAMMADGTWVPAHSMLAVGSALLLVGLLAVKRSGAWAPAARVLPFAVVATAVNTVELLLHTVAVVDKEALARNESPFVAMAHVVAAVVAYPVFGIAIALLAWHLLRTWAAPLRAVSVAGIVGGIANALSTPLVVLARVDGADALFPIAGITIALWLIVAGVAGIRVPATADAVPAPA